ncbi:MAG TPA: hypothetical protein VFM68_02155 [Candidatus Saccharimonadales bacterium]|nr:hypothetical protein [Candidatus Saccharimonadales bacterium]
MKQHMRGVTSVKVRTWAIIAVSAIITSILVSIVTFQHAGALLNADDLLRTATKPIERILYDDNNDKSSPSASQQQSERSNSNDSESSQNAAPHAAAPMTPSHANNATNNTQRSVQQAQNAHESLPAMTPIDINQLPPSATKLAYTPSFASMPMADIATPTKTTAQLAPIQATQRGWQIIGVMWYWWLLGVVLVLTIGKLTMQLLARRNAIKSAFVN